MNPAQAGLQAERTSLAWSRTSLALLANGGLLLTRFLGGRADGAELVVAVSAVLLAGGAAVLGRRRSRAVLSGCWPGAAVRSLRLLGGLVVTFCSATVVVLVT